MAVMGEKMLDITANEPSRRYIFSSCFVFVSVFLFLFRFLQADLSSGRKQIG
jgi:hypothetical protein